MCVFVPESFSHGPGALAVVGEGGRPRGQETCWDRGPGPTALHLVTIATPVVTMDTLWRTVACTVMVAVVIAGESESHKAEKSARSQGENEPVTRSHYSNALQYHITVRSTQRDTF